MNLRSTRYASLGVLTSLFMAGMIPQFSYAQLEEITVTARRVEESLQDTPVAVTAFTGDELEASGAIDLVDVGDKSPNVNIATSSTVSGLSSAPSVFIRGIGQNDFVIVTDPAIGMYLDGIYMGRSIGSLLDLVDLERVEVLRGPQGTLYGRNSIGGAINFVSRRPDLDALSGKASVTVGEDEHYEFGGSVNVPFSDKAAGRFSAMYRHRDGFVDALQYDDVKLGDDNVWAVRGQLLFEPTDKLTIELSGDYSSERENPAPLVGVNLGGGTGSPSDSGMQFTNNAMGGNASVIFNRSATVAMGVVDLTGSPNVSNDPACAVANPDLGIGPPANNPNCHGNYWLGGSYGSNSLWTDELGNVIDPENELDSFGFGAHITLDTDFGTLKSITAWRKFEADFVNDLDQTPHFVFQNHNNTFDNSQVSQEFQYIHTLFNDKLDVTAGLYWFEEDGVENVRLLNGPQTDVFAGIGMGGMVPLAPLMFDNPRYSLNESLAAYAQAILHVTERLHLTGGIRWTKDTKDHELAQNWFDGTSSSSIGRLEFKEVTPLISVGYDFSEDIFGYITWSEGFRDGGFPARFGGSGGGLPEPLPGFGPEFVTSYEAGIKSEFLDNRVRLNVNGFFTDYQDFQANAAPANLPPGTLGATVINVGDTEIYGFESEITALVNDNLTLNLTLGYLDSEILCINTFNADGTPIECNPGNIATSAGFNITVDNQLPRLPDWSWNLGANYRMPVDGMMDGAVLTWRANWTYRGEQQSDLVNYVDSFTNDWSRVDASVTLTPPGRHWSLALGARNLLDEDITVSKQFGGPLAGIFAAKARPRQVYGTFRYNFGDF